MIFLLIVVAAYLLGSIPFGLLVARARGIDIRKHGSGNIGATNVSRTLGKKWGILVFAFDFLKGAVAALLPRLFALLLFYSPFSYLAQNSSETLATKTIDEGHATYAMMAGSRFSPPVVFGGILCGLAAILGHNFPVWLRFKGGKGIATSGGVILALMPVPSVICIAIWCIVFQLTKYVSLASIVAAAALPLVVWLVLVFAHLGGWALVWFSLAIAALAIWRHKANIQRLLAGTESRFGKKSEQK